MGINTSKGKDKLFTEINITPLTDIFLVLLIIMMVVAPSFQSTNTEITQPEINSGLSVDQHGTTVSITKDGRFYLNGVPIADTDLIKGLQDSQLVNSEGKKEVIVKADEKTKSSEIMKVMRAAQEAQYHKLTVAGEPLSKKEQKELEKEVEYAQALTKLPNE